jgi:hypothetical protein
MMAAIEFNTAGVENVVIPRKGCQSYPQTVFKIEISMLKILVSRENNFSVICGEKITYVGSFL